MKIKSLLMGSVAAAGLTTGAFAADPAMVLTSLDVCDALGLTGLVISSDTNCLQITGEVKYEFNWGDFRGEEVVTAVAGGYGTFNIIGNDEEPDGRDNDWNSRVDYYLKFVGTADTDIGPAKAVIKIKEVDHVRVRNEDNLGANAVADSTFYVDGLALNEGRGADNLLGNADDILINFGPDGVRGGGDDITGLRSAVLDDYAGGGSDTAGVVIDEAYVSIGGSTMLMAGKKGSIMNLGDDEPFNWLGLFLSEKVDKGVKWRKDFFPDGGHVIQVVSDLGNGIGVGAGLENLNGVGTKAGTAVGFISYTGENITAHATGVAGGILDGTVERFGGHAGFTATFDNFKIRAAVAGDHDDPTDTSYWNALASAEATFDMFTLAISGEAADETGGANADGDADFGVGASAGFTITEGVSINLGGRFYQNNLPGDVTETAYQVALQVKAAVTETITITGEVGVFGCDDDPAVVPAGCFDLDEATPSETDVYGKVELAWAPGGGLTSSLAGEVHQNGGYKVTFKAAKAFQ